MANCYNKVKFNDLDKLVEAKGNLPVVTDFCGLTCNTSTNNYKQHAMTLAPAYKNCN